MSTTIEYTAGAELPDLALELLDASGTVIDFSSGWTFTVRVGPTAGGAALFTKTTAISGAATSPNVVVGWSTAGELSALAPGQYRLELWCRRTADSKDRCFAFPLRIVAGLT
jgi:hypothetical protein